MVENIEALEPSRETDEALEQSAEEAPLTSEEGAELESAAQPSEQSRSNDPQKRINQYRARLARAEEQRDYWRDQAQRVEHEKSLRKEPEPSDPEPEPPNPESFQGDYDALIKAQDKYLKDVRDWDKRQARETEERRQREAEESRRRDELTARQQKTVAMLQSGQSAHEDFGDLVYDPDLRISQDMMDIATDMENGHEVLYALGQKPAEAARIAALSGRTAAMAMGQFAASLSQQSPKGTGAPRPPSPAKGGGDTAEVDDDKLSTAEAIRRDRERRAKLGRN